MVAPAAQKRSRIVCRPRLAWEYRDGKEPQCSPLGNSLEVLQTQSCPKEFVMVVLVMVIGLTIIAKQDQTSTRDPTPSDCRYEDIIGSYELSLENML